MSREYNLTCRKCSIKIYWVDGVTERKIYSKLTKWNKILFYLLNHLLMGIWECFLFFGLPFLPALTICPPPHFLYPLPPSRVPAVSWVKGFGLPGLTQFFRAKPPQNKQIFISPALTTSWGLTSMCDYAVNLLFPHSIASKTTFQKEIMGEKTNWKKEGRFIWQHLYSTQRGSCTR